MNVPERIANEQQLEDLLSEPSEAAVQALARVAGDVIVLGAAGKMGPSLVRMLRRASDQLGTARRIFAVSRFSRPALADALRRVGVEPIQGDLLDEDFVADLPDAESVIFMTGVKFGTSDDASSTWAVNTYVPSLICRRYRSSRILAFSTGNVYPLVPVDSGGSVETDRCDPVGEYGMSALGRERMFEYFSRRQAIPTTIIRLNYAVEMRYGVLIDLANQVWSNEAVDLSMGHANVIWQADANALALAALADADVPPCVLNVAGAEQFAVREACQQLGRLLDRQPQFAGQEAPTALLSNAGRAYERYGRPRVPLARMIAWTADWVARGQPTWDKPTHFQVRNGQF